MKIAIKDFAEEYRNFHHAFASAGGETGYLEYVVGKALLLKNSLDSTHQAFKEENSNLAKQLRLVNSSAAELLVLLRSIDSETANAIFPSGAIGAVANIATLAGNLHATFTFKDKRSGRIKHLRRHFFRAAIEPYVRAKGIKFPRHRGSISFNTYMDNWAGWLGCIAPKMSATGKPIMCSCFKGIALHPDDISEHILTVTQECKDTPLTRSWWNQGLKSKSPEINDAIINGIMAYILWKRKTYRLTWKRKLGAMARPLDKEEKRYARFALTFLKRKERVSNLTKDWATVNALLNV